MSIRTNIFSLTKLFEDGHVMEISLEFERRAKAYNELLAENERLRAELDFFKKATRLETWDGETWVARYEILRHDRRVDDK